MPFSGSSAKLDANESPPKDNQSGGGDGSSRSFQTSTGGAVALETAAWSMLGVAVAGNMAVL